MSVLNLCLHQVLWQVIFPRNSQSYINLFMYNVSLDTGYGWPVVKRINEPGVFRVNNLVSKYWMNTLKNPAQPSHA